MVETQWGLFIRHINLFLPQLSQMLGHAKGVEAVTLFFGFRRSLFGDK